MGFLNLIGLKIKKSVGYCRGAVSFKDFSAYSVLPPAVRLSPLAKRMKRYILKDAIWRSKEAKHVKRSKYSISKRLINVLPANFSAF